MIITFPDGGELQVADDGSVSGSYAPHYAHDASMGIKLGDTFYGEVTVGQGVEAAVVWGLFWGGKVTHGEPPPWPQMPAGWIS